mmetsp:Transcript_12081/g.36404  ORF Transcript_12081/g.36404 Transcript_12081/m.36404 type:complete len:336 (-) Transcript_12081:212-1219(-)
MSMLLFSAGGGSGGVAPPGCCCCWSSSSGVPRSCGACWEGSAAPGATPAASRRPSVIGAQCSLSLLSACRTSRWPRGGSGTAGGDIIQPGRGPGAPSSGAPGCPPRAPSALRPSSSVFHSTCARDRRNPLGDKEETYHGPVLAALDGFVEVEFEAFELVGLLAVEGGVFGEGAFADGDVAGEFLGDAHGAAVQDLREERAERRAVRAVRQRAAVEVLDHLLRKSDLLLGPLSRPKRHRARRLRRRRRLLSLAKRRRRLRQAAQRWQAAQCCLQLRRQLLLLAWLLLLARGLLRRRARPLRFAGLRRLLDWPLDAALLLVSFHREATTTRSQHCGM